MQGDDIVYLFKLGFIEIDFSSVISFLVGILLGCIIMALIYALLLAMSLRNKKFLVKTEDDSLTNQEVKAMVLEAQKQFKDRGLRGDKSKIGYCKELCAGLVQGIAARFYPNSKTPYLELSVEESVMLMGYIQRRIDELLDRRILKQAKRLKISSIVSVSEKALQVTDSKLFDLSKKGIGAVKSALNVVNPAYWFRKLVMDNAINLILGKICLVIIAVVGEESYKIYSKSLFNKELSIETNIEEILDSIDTDMSKLKNDAKNNTLSLNEEDSSEPLHKEDLAFFKKRILKDYQVDSSYEAIFDSNMEYKSKAVEPSIMEDYEDEEI